MAIDIGPGAIDRGSSSASGNYTIVQLGNPANAYYAIIYNYTDAAKDALAFVDLNGPIDMTAGDLTITWNASGLFTIT